MSRTAEGAADKRLLGLVAVGFAFVSLLGGGMAMGYQDPARIAVYGTVVTAAVFLALARFIPADGDTDV